MKKLLIVVLGVFSIMLQTLNAQDLSIVSNQDEDTTQVVLKGNGEQCNLWMYVVDGQLVSTDCKKMRNSKNVDIVCTKTKKICKTIEEVKSFVNGDDSTMYSGDSGIYEVTATKLNIRDKPSISGKVLGAVNQGDRIKISEFSGKWGRSAYGWISGKHLKKISSYSENTRGSSDLHNNVDANDYTTQTYKEESTSSTDHDSFSWWQIILALIILGVFFTYWQIILGVGVIGVIGYLVLTSLGINLWYLAIIIVIIIGLVAYFNCSGEKCPECGTCVKEPANVDLLGQHYKHQNKNGTPDKRHKDNPLISTYKYTYACPSEECKHKFSKTIEI